MRIASKIGKKSIAYLIGVLTLSLVPLATANPITHTDSFEGASIDPFWTIIGPGNATLSTATAFAGSQSLQLQAVSSSPYYVDLYHDFGSQQTGSVSIYLQDGTVCCGSSAAFGVTDDVFGAALGFIQRDPGGAGFTARFVPPGAGEVPGTTLSRSGMSWDQIEIDTGLSGLTMNLNGVTVFSDSRVTSFRTVELVVETGPGGSESFDSFSSTTEDAQTSVPEPPPLSLLGSILLGFAAKRRILAKHHGI